MRENLTDGTVKKTRAPERGQAWIWDTEVGGLGLRVTASGLKAFVLDYRTKGGRRRRYDRFRHRIMFPIRNPRGQVIGFGGRLLEGGDTDPRGAARAKYVNSPETPLFHKGRELYGQFEAREAIRAAGCVIVVEGYMDVVMLAQHGVRNVVAALGTATTEDHVHKLLRLADRVVFAFDGDAAGRRAAWRALEACLTHLPGRAGRVFVLRELAGLEPDEVCKECGISPSNYWVTMHRARLRLRECLEANWFAPARAR